MPPSKAVQAEVMRNVGIFSPKVTAVYEGIDIEAIKADPTPHGKVKTIWLVGSAMSSAITPHSACKHGCNHCCSQAVTINSVEADIIATSLQVRYNEVPDESLEEFLAKVDKQRIEFTGKQCPFIQEDKCSIYEVRPMSCRLHFNISNNPSLCDTNIDAEVPNLNFTSLNKLQVIALSSGEIGERVTWSDIRDYFPMGINTPKIKTTIGSYDHTQQKQDDYKEDTKS